MIRSLRVFGIALLLCVGGEALAQSQYAAKITVNSGSSFVVKRLDIKGDRIYSENGSASSSIGAIEAVEFRFPGLSLSMCDSMFRTGDRKALEDLLNQNLGPVAQFSYLPTNLGEYLIWWLRTQYWVGNEAAAGKTVGYIRQTKDPKYVDEASMYFVMMLLDQGKLENARTVLANVGDPEAVSVPMAEYLNGKIAMESGDYRTAMLHVARIVAFHSRNEEWMPPATVLEAEIYQRLGQPQKAEAVANELIMAYPGTRWSRAGETIKKESTGTRGE
ncbi:hypothetical protein P4E94_02995 [Pontiellaceae bacterium B12219]|nr:hypothetical protein [Pontiellaceae bacterium B12219]